MIMLAKITFIVGLGLFAAMAFAECVEAKRTRRESRRVEGVVRSKYPRVF